MVRPSTLFVTNLSIFRQFGVCFVDLSDRAKMVLSVYKLDVAALFSFSQSCDVF